MKTSDTSPNPRKARSRFRALGILCAISALTLSACATQLDRPPVDAAAVLEEGQEVERIRVATQLERMSRVWAVGDRIRIAGTDLCGDRTAYDFGLRVTSRETLFEDSDNPPREIGLGSGVRVWDARAEVQALGIRRNVRIVEIDHVRIHELADYQKAIKTAQLQPSLTLGFEDDDGFRRETLSGVMACDYAVSLNSDPEINAFADGSNVFVNAGMIRFVESDDELAIVIGHEIAHNVLGHPTQRKAQIAVGAVFDVAIAVLTGIGTNTFSMLGAGAFSEGQESDSDYMGLYLAARAGYRVEAAPSFWHRMGAETHDRASDTMLRSHPSNSRRAAAMRAAIREIESKRFNHQPLLPEGSETVAANASRRPNR